MSREQALEMTLGNTGKGAASVEPCELEDRHKQPHEINKNPRSRMNDVAFAFLWKTSCAILIPA